MKSNVPNREEYTESDQRILVLIRKFRFFGEEREPTRRFWKESKVFCDCWNQLQGSVYGEVVRQLGSVEVLGLVRCWNSLK